jgi:Ca-activated chloride channel family protein
MKILFITTILMGSLWASLFDFKYLEEAKNAYEDKNYTKAERLYKKVENDEAKFNEADTLYRQKRYKEAIEAYEQVNDAKLLAKKLHNIGNSYAQLKKIDEAITAYEEALTLGNDADTKFNLELLKKKKKKQDDKKKEDKEKKDKDKNNEKKDPKDSDKEKSKKEKEKEESEKKKREKEKEEKKKKEEQKQ